MRALAAAVCMAGLGMMPAMAQDAMDVSTMTCADYMALSGDDRMAAMQAVEDAHSAMAADVPTDAPTDAMASDDTASTDAAADAATDTMASGDMGTAADNPMVQEIMAGCEGNPDMMVMNVQMTPM